MAYTKNKKNSFDFSKFKVLISWLFPLSFILIAVFTYVKKQIKTMEDEPNKNASAEKVVRDNKVSAERGHILKDITNQLAEALGTNGNKFNPFNWFEDDQKAFNLLQNITQNDFNIISKLYKSTYAKGRSLSTDLANLLDKKYYNALTIK